MKNILFAFLIFSSGLIVSSCANNEDTEAPTIEVIKPKENEVVLIGKTLNMKFRFTDEYGVRYYSYELFNEEGDVPGAFTHKKELNIAGLLTDFEIEHSVNIPKMNSKEIPTAPGDYILRVVAVDIYNNSRILDHRIKLEKDLTNQE